MNKIDEARALLKELNVPAQQQADLCCYTLLAMADIKENSSWANATNDWIRIHDLLLFLRKHYQVIYAENSRETFRKQAMHHFRNAAFIEDNGKATNSPNYRYRLTEEMLDLIRSYGTDTWADKKEKFLATHESLISMYESKRSMLKMPVNINGSSFTFSPGKHNELQKAIIEEFAPRFAPNSELHRRQDF